MPPNDSGHDNELADPAVDERQARPPAAAPREDLVGERVASRYRIESQLGAGPIGQVYRAVRDDGLLVALKVLDEKHRPDPNVVRRFLREAEAAKALEHPSIARTLEVGTDERGRPYVCSELVDGQPITQAVQAGPLSLRRILEPLCETLSALSEAHRHGILHRCLKPCNVLVREEPEQKLVVKVRDFGMGRLLKPVPGTGTTKHGRSCGEAEYMAPEQANVVDIDGRTDVYAAGVILYELLTGQVPFRGANAAAILAKHASEPVVPPSKLRVDRRIPREVESVCMRALAKEPRERYQSPREMRTAVRSALELLGARADLPIEAPPSDDSKLHHASRDRLTMPGEQLRSKQKVGVGAALLTAVCVALYMSAPPPEPDGQPQEPSSSGASESQPAGESQLAGESPLAEASTALALGRQRLERGDAQGALEPLRRAEALLGPTAEVARWLGEALVRSGDVSRGRALLQRYLQLAPQAEDQRDVRAMLDGLNQ